MNTKPKSIEEIFTDQAEDAQPAYSEARACSPAPALVGVLAALSLLGSVGVGMGAADAAAANVPAENPPPSRTVRRSSPERISPDVKAPLDRSGRKRVGKASFYAQMFAGRKMADGTRMQPTANNAASRTLPLGTTAKVTNLETGKTAVVTIRDRGPYVVGRIVDLSPTTAREIGLDRRTGVTQVEVLPITVPMPDGKIKLGDGILVANNRVEPDESNSRTLRTP
jgi:rare lipoprotein A